MTDATALLDGLRVLDLSRLLPGPYDTHLLADLGADVVKVEQPGTGDGLRTTAPWTADGEGALHVVLNRGKRSVALDLRSEDARNLLLELATRADAVLESFRPGVLDRLGLGWNALRAAAPRVVLVSITAWGEEPSVAKRPGHDINVQGAAGALLLPGPAGAGPAPPATQVADLAAGLQAAIGLLAAVRHAERTGHGEHVRVSMLDAALAMLPIATTSTAVTGVAPGPGEDVLTGALACYACYRCADGGWLALGALEPKFFARLAELVDRPQLAALQYDAGRQVELRRELAAVFSGQDRAHWLELLEDEDTCVSAVLDVREALAAAVARGAAWGATAPGSPGGSGGLGQVAPAIRVGAGVRGETASGERPQPAPALGADDAREVLRQWR